ncbi:hypothetical protein OGH69_00245 [Flavobacterium sp. MFBS3-15]|uniref:hypothetical protein n=1 Tax=Flavobacterium sp. MFBS3-15 TaxID=2989816 RepID=UPI0022367300|nr:hypothetical protein [Flavobacterium sp. MFBS3-15]MCW4467386.1 hypothetical protein [Flavobacterium sp. MFBS3-15]
MKKNIFKFAALFIFSSVMLTSCEEETVTFDGRNGQSIAAFRQDAQELAVNSEGESSVTVLVDVTTVSNQDRAVVVSIDPDRSTAEAADYVIDPASLIVPAGAYNAEIKILGNFDELPDSGSVDLVLLLDSVEGATLDTRQETSVSIFKVCPITESLAGTHTYVQYDISVGNGSGGIQQTLSGSFDGTITWTENGTPDSGKYFIGDLSFGMYPTVYNDGPATGTGVNKAGVEWVCNKIKATGKDQYGDSFTYTMVSVSGPIMTFKYINGYGDRGTVDLIRQDGENWPDIMQTN